MTALRAGRSGIARIQSFDVSTFACQIAAGQRFDPARRKKRSRNGRFIQLAIAASECALATSGLKYGRGRERTGVCIGSGIGGFDVIEREHKTIWITAPAAFLPFVPAIIINMASGYVSIRTGAQGPNTAPSTACTTGAHGIGDSFRLIQHGYADAMICGGAEACITPMGIGGFGAMRALTTRNAEPERASRPWDQDRDGFIVGEGAGILILEELDTARRRGAPIIAEMVGYGMSGDAHHVSSPPEDGNGAYRVMRNAIQGTPGFGRRISITSTRTAPPPSWATRPRPRR